MSNILGFPIQEIKHHLAKKANELYMRLSDMAAAGRSGTA